MKRYIYLAIAAIMLVSCSKKGEKATVPLITRVTANGGIAYKFHYNSKNQIIRWETYAYETLGNPMTSQWEFTYAPDGLLSELAVFSEPGKVPGSRLIFTRDESKNRLSGFQFYDLQGLNPAQPYRSGVFNYNASNRMTSAVIRDKDGELDVQHNLSYFENGLLKQRDSYEETITNQLRLRERNIYSLPVPNMVTGWEPILVIPLDGIEIARTVHYDGIQRYVYNNGVLTGHRSELVSAREYNDDGTLKRHAYVRKMILPAQPDHEANWEFEYVKQ